MNPYLSVTFRTFTIWIMAAVINGILSGIYLSIMENELERVLPSIFLCGIISLILSVTGFGIFWIIMLTSININIYERQLFRTALSTALILSTATGIVSIKLIKTVTSGEWYLFIVFIIISAITSVMIHFRLFKKIGWHISAQKIN